MCTNSIQCNFTSFLIGRDGRMLGCFASAVNPQDEQVIDFFEDAFGAAQF